MSVKEDEKQAVVDEAPGAAEPAPAVDNAREGDDIETLLKQFESETRVVDSPPEPKSQDELLKKVTDQVRASIQQEQASRAAVGELVKTVRGEVPESVFSDKEIEHWLAGQATDDPKLANAWQFRDKNPGAWKKIEAELSKKFNSKFQNLPDPVASADKEAVAAAVRGASTKVPAEQPPDLGSMTNREFAEYTRKLFR